MLIGVLGACSSDLEWSKSIALLPEDTETAALVEAADARWEAAGAHPDAIRVEASNGVPVGWLPASDSMGRVCDLPDSRNVCGCVALHARSGPTHVWLHRKCANRNVIAHELGHLLARRPQHLGSADGCGKRNDPLVKGRPLMCPIVGDSITTADLSLVCELGACIGFAPETAVD
jgi:hypothetical protein